MDNGTSTIMSEATISLIVLGFILLCLNIFCTTVSIVVVSKFTQVLKVIDLKEQKTIYEYVPAEPTDTQTLTESIESIRIMMEKFMWFYVAKSNQNTRTMKNIIE